MTVLMVCSVALYGAESTVYGATFSVKSPFKIYDSDIGKSAKVTYNHNSKFKNYLLLDGVDISAWQDELNSSKISSNVDFAILRTSYTGSNATFSMGKDSKFAQHYKNAKAAGKLIGVYEYSQAKTTAEAIKEADFLVEQLNEVGVKPSDLALPVYIDYEFGGRLTSSIKKTTARKTVRAFCERIKELGYVPGIYANLSTLTSTLDGDALGEEYDIWCAQYYTSCGFGGNYSKWQYSSSARIEGLYNNGKKTNIDANFWYIDKNRKSSDPNDIASCKFTVPEKVLYTGSGVKPDVTVTNATGTLKKNTDYAVHYINNVNKGTGYAYIVGLGAYSGYKLVSFNIVNTLDVLGVDDLELTTKGVDAGYSLTDEGLVGIVAGTKVSAVKSSVALKDTESGYVINIADKSSGENLAKSDKVTTGDKITICDDTGEVLGKVALEVQGTKTKFTSIKGGKKKITLKWKKLASSKATGYQIQYCLYEDMPSEYVGTKNVTSYKTVSATLKTNYNGKYYVRIRSYKTIRSKKNYSPWSNVKSVKVK